MARGLLIRLIAALPAPSLDEPTMTLFKHTLAALALSLGTLGTALATPMVKEYSTVWWNMGDGVANTVAAVGGMSYGGRVASVASLTGTDVLVAGQWDGAATSWVAAGGIYIIHDWGNGASALPGLAGATYANHNWSDINVIDGSSAIVNGPAGTINNATLDGGNASNHGAWALSSLVSTDPLAGVVHAILSATSASAVVMFEMGYGQGHILYANIPLEAYTDGSPLVTGPQPAGLQIYAKNELAYAKALLGGSQPGNNANNSQVPEPGSALLALVALAAAAGVRRRARG